MFYVALKFYDPICWIIVIMIRIQDIKAIFVSDKKKNIDDALDTILGGWDITE